MKKQIVTACALIASVAAFATSVESSNTFGVLKLAGSEEMVICVPWVAVGSGDNPISPTDLVLASNRIQGDMLYMYDMSNPQSTGYKAWTINNAAWESTSTYNIKNGSVSSIEKTGNESLVRGGAMILKLQNDSNDQYPDVFLSGQYTTAGASVAIASPITGQVVPAQVYYTLIANPTMSAVDLNAQSGRFYTDANLSTAASASDMTGDMILFADGSSYSCDETGWFKWQLANPSVAAGLSNPMIKVREGVTIPANSGAWYVRKAHSSSLWIKWADATAE